VFDTPEYEKRVYDHPITAAVDPVVADMTVTEYTTYTTYELSQDTLELTIGYALPADVPAGLKLAMMMIVDNMYQSRESEYDTERIDEQLRKYKRFLI
jgi:hypothetical protein